MIFVVAFNRASSKLEEYRQFPESERSQAEILYRSLLANAMFHDNKSVEVNMFKARSEDIFRKTHSRYFETPARLMHGIIEQLRSTLPK